MNVLVLDGGHCDEKTPKKVGMLIVLGPIRPTGHMLPNEGFTRKVLENLMMRIDAISRVFVPDEVERAAFASPSQSIPYWHVLSNQTATEDQLWGAVSPRRSYYHPSPHYPLDTIPYAKCGKLTLLIQGEGDKATIPWKLEEARQRADGYSKLRQAQWKHDPQRQPLRLGFGEVPPQTAPLDFLVSSRPPRSSPHALRGWENRGIDVPLASLHAFPVDKTSTEKHSSHVPFVTWVEITI